MVQSILHVCDTENLETVRFLLVFVNSESRTARDVSREVRLLRWTDSISEHRFHRSTLDLVSNV